MSRLVVVSNRVAIPDPQGEKGAQGGLAVALDEALAQSKGLWFGWSGNTASSYTGEVNCTEVGGVTFATVDLGEKQVDEYYNGYANRTLWPLFHYRLGLADFDNAFGKRYEAVNAALAAALAPMIRPDDRIWIHDYHFIPMADELRKLGISNKIGFFLHTPWPPHRLLQALPYHQRLVRTMLAYDLIGFQSDDWRESFLHYCERELDANVEGTQLTHEGRSLCCMTFPIGIDADAFADMVKTPEAQATLIRTRDNVPGKIIVGVDRLDYSKGLIERFEGYRTLLEREDWHNKVTLLQIAPPSRAQVRAYKEIRGKLDALSGRINGQYARVDWVPIRYVNRGYSREQLAGIFHGSHVGLVTSLRDGMNLVAKEYVAAQDPDDPGVLILSQFTGAAAQMDAALPVNPHAKIDIAKQIDRALTMSRDERVERWQTLFAGLQREDVHWWAREYLSALGKC
ncbi:trehalose-6-phosphate synthase [Sphingomicrobium sp. XHP0239]|uniref:alpha,alpha-trehalose-phosphate synthase (UDP-forming) n=1 Tax=Sphingomicrobium maritimum TaxID=3133972 RepID=UPI0031CCAF17